MSKYVKQLMIGSIRSQVGAAQDLLVLDMSKVDAVTETKFRLAMFKKNICVLGVKNAVARRALSEVGITTLDHALQGASTLVWGAEDPVALAREIIKAAKDYKNLEVKGGTLSGTPLSKDDVEVLSKSPGRIELLGQLVGLILSPGRRLAGALLGPGGRLAGQVQALAEKEETPAAD